MTGSQFEILIDGTPRTYRDHDGEPPRVCRRVHVWMPCVDAPRHGADRLL